MSPLPNGGQGDASAASLGERRRKVRTPAVNPGPGSYRLLAMLARLGVAGVEPLACGLRLSTGSTYSHLRRLEKAGLVWRVPLRDGGGGAVAISRVGALRVRDEGLPAVFPKSQVPSTGEHARAVSLLGEPLRIITLDDIIDMARKAARGEP